MQRLTELKARRIAVQVSILELEQNIDRNKQEMDSIDKNIAAIEAEVKE